MGRIRDPNRDRAFEMWKSSNGKMDLINIASTLGVPAGSVRGWKAKDHWDARLNDKADNGALLQKKERSAPKKGMERSKKTERSKKNIERAEPVLNIEVDNEELTDKQRLFCIYYVKCFNATQAAIKAGYASESAHVEGSRLLRNAKVAEEIRRLKSNMANALFIDAMDVLNKYAAIAFADINDYVDFGQQEVPLMTKKGPVYNPNGEVMTVKQSFVALRNAGEVDGALISEVKDGKDGVSVKLHDKMKALEMLTKYFDLLPDQHKRMVEEEKLKLDRERLELDKAKAAGEGDSEDELIEDWAEAVIDDGSNESEEDET